MPSWIWRETLSRLGTLRERSQNQTHLQFFPLLKKVRHGWAWFHHDCDAGVNWECGLPGRGGQLDTGPLTAVSPPFRSNPAILMHAHMHARSHSHVWLFATSWTQLAKLLYPWDFPGKNTRVDCHFLFQGITPTLGLNPHLLHLLHCRQILHFWATW